MESLLDCRRVYLGLGSNMGDREGALAGARRALVLAGARLLRSSSIYGTDPVGLEGHGEFLNQVVGCVTDLSPEALLNLCLRVERSLGRVRGPDKGSRVIDVDLLLYGDAIRRGSGVDVPHPRMHLRRFVLIPLVEIDPGARHPLLGLTASELLARCPDRSRVERLAGPGGARLRGRRRAAIMRPFPADRCG